MQVAYEVFRANARHPGSVKVGQFKLSFGSSTAAGRQATEAAKATWVGRMTVPVETREAPIQRAG